MTIRDKITDALYSGKIAIKDADIKPQHRPMMRSQWGGKSDPLAEALKTGKLFPQKPEELKEAKKEE